MAYAGGRRGSRTVQPMPVRCIFSVCSVKNEVGRTGWRIGPSRSRKPISKILIDERRGRSAIGPVWVRPCVNSNTGVRVLNVGGNWNNGTNAGVSNANGNNNSTNTNTNIGGRLDYASSKFDRDAVQHHSKRGYDHATKHKITSNDSHSARNQGTPIRRMFAGDGRTEVSKPTAGGMP